MVCIIATTAAFDNRKETVSKLSVFNALLTNRACNYILDIMRKIFFVVFSLLLYNSCLADNLDEKLFQIQTEMERIHYTYPEARQSAAFQPLLKKANALTGEYPSRAEPIILHAAVILTNAATESAFAALSSVKKARDLLIKAISIDPKAKQGSAYVTLGTLYYKVPGWPISFGDDDLAEEFLLTALNISPDAIDTNYFYGDFLLSQGKFKEGVIHLEKAIHAPYSGRNTLGKTKLREKARLALNRTELNKLSDAKDSIPPHLESHGIGNHVISQN